MAVDTLPDVEAARPEPEAARPETHAGHDVSPTSASGPDRRTRLARAIVAILARTIPDDAGLRVSLDTPRDRDGGSAQALGPSPAGTHAGAAHVRVRGPDAVGRLVLRPTEDGFAEGYLRGDLDIDGDVAKAIEAARRMDPRRLSPADVRRLVRHALELRRGTPSAPPLRRLASLSGPRHSRARDLEAVRFHYDVGEAFYHLWLDRRLTYSCAYFERSDDPAHDLDDAQEAKLDLVCRKLGLEPGQRLLDVGCGWRRPARRSLARGACTCPRHGRASRAATWTWRSSCSPGHRRRGARHRGRCDHGGRGRSVVPFRTLAPSGHVQWTYRSATPGPMLGVPGVRR